MLERDVVQAVEQIRTVPYVGGLILNLVQLQPTIVACTRVRFPSNMFYTMIHGKGLQYRPTVHK